MAGCEVVRVSGYDRCSRAMEDNRGRTVFVYFVGSKDAEGRNWCSDSERAEPIVQEAMKYIPAGAVFIYCQVGDRSYWNHLS
uniref:Thioredoxin domain-containing protein 17 n=1 Tax=Ornithorhynchus anatinus TaxID=9258 RepID=F7F4X4_ORNAN